MVMNQDYENFVERMGSFEMDLESIPKKEEPLTHWGVTRKDDTKDKPYVGATVYVERSNK